MCRRFPTRELHVEAPSEILKSDTNDERNVFLSEQSGRMYTRIGLSGTRGMRQRNMYEVLTAVMHALERAIPSDKNHKDSESLFTVGSYLRSLIVVMWFVR